MDEETVSGIILTFMVLVLAGAFACARIREHEGIGNAPKGPLRAPHGRLVAVRAVQGAVAFRRLPLFARCLAVSYAVAAALVTLDASFSSTLPTFGVVTGLGVWCSIVAAAVGARTVGMRQALLYGFAGYVLLGVLLMLPIAMVEFAVGIKGYVLYLLMNGAAIAGTCLGIAWAPQRVRFERTFEDGTVDTLWVSARAGAFSRLSELAAA